MPSRSSQEPLGDDRFGSVRLDQVDKRSIRSYLDGVSEPRGGEPSHSRAEVGMELGSGAPRIPTTRA